MRILGRPAEDAMGRLGMSVGGIAPDVKTKRCPFRISNRKSLTLLGLSLKPPLGNTFPSEALSQIGMSFASIFRFLFDFCKDMVYQGVKSLEE